jgi:tetratricopeptide (TPR) repeat protein
MDEALAEPAPPADQPLSRVMHQYARGTALAAKGRVPEAAAALDSLHAAHAAVKAWKDATAMTVADIAALSLAARVAEARGDHAAAVRDLRKAAAIEDGMSYMEPPEWYVPVRWQLGRALLASGDAAGAERAYREDLKRFPENGWSLAGLVASLEKQGKKSEAAAARVRLEKARSGADVDFGAAQPVKRASR